MAISFKDKIAYVNKYAPKDNDKVQKLIKLAVNIDSQKLNLNADQKAKLKDGVEKAFAQIKTKRESSQTTPSAPAKKRGRPKGSTKASKAQKSSGALKDFKKKIGRKLYAKATTGTRIDIDMERPAVKPGKRIVRKKGQTSNQYGTFSNKVGRKYWENRANRMDINQPSKTRYPKLEDGGSIAKGNYEMVLSKAKELHHHASELQDALKKEKNIEAWVVAKVERASQDLSDVTHYLDGMSEYGEGGKVEGNYVAVGEKDGYWTIITKPTTKEKAQQMIDMGSLPKGEVGKVVTVQEAKDHKKVIGREYLAQGGTLAGNLDVDNIGFGLMAKGGMTMQAIADKYEKNEDDNAHSENVVLLAKHFGTAEELKEAKAILKKHNEEGSLSTENGAKRRDLHLKLIAKARKEMMQEGVNFAKGGKLSRKQRNLDMNNNGKLDKEDFQIIRSGKRIVRKNKK